MTVRPPENRPRHHRVAALVLLACFVALMWVVEGVDQLLGSALDDDGVRPREVEGLWGILAQPFLHAGWGHLAGNSVGLLALGSVIALSGLRVLVSVTVVSWLLSGLASWLLGGFGTVHIGASGIVFGYIFFVILRGLFTRRVLHLLVGLVAAGYYGFGALAGLSPLQDGVSWQGHLGGAVAGVVAASGVRTRPKAAVPPGPSSSFAAGGPRP